MSDLIERQAVEAITWEEPSYTDALNALTEVREKIRALPSVSTEKTGRWEKHGTKQVQILPTYKCSVCGFVDLQSNFNYCPNCGCKMEVEE